MARKLKYSETGAPIPFTCKFCGGKYLNPCDGKNEQCMGVIWTRDGLIDNPIAKKHWSKKAKAKHEAELKAKKERALARKAKKSGNKKTTKKRVRL